MYGDQAAQVARSLYRVTSSHTLKILVVKIQIPSCVNAFIKIVYLGTKMNILMIFTYTMMYVLV